MAKDSLDTLKAVLFVALLFAGAALAALFILDAWLAYGRGLPLVSGLPDYRPPNTVQMLAFMRPLAVVAGCWLVAAGAALLLRSPYIDHMLQIFAKAFAMLAAAYLGVIAGHWAYLRMTRTGDVEPEGLARLAVVFVAATLIAMFLRLESLRPSPPVRYIAAILAILLGPLLLVTGP